MYDGVCGCVCVWGCVGVLAAVTLPAHMEHSLLRLAPTIVRSNIPSRTMIEYMGYWHNTECYRVCGIAPW